MINVECRWACYQLYQLVADVLLLSSDAGAGCMSGYIPPQSSHFPSSPGIHRLWKSIRVTLGLDSRELFWTWIKSHILGLLRVQRLQIFKTLSHTGKLPNGTSN